MKASRDPVWLQELVTRSGFLDAYPNANPHSPDFATVLTSHLDQAAYKLWDRLRLEFSGESDETILRNTWAIASADPLLASAVWRAAVLQRHFSDALRSTLRNLRSLHLERASVPVWLDPIIEPTLDSIPDLSGMQHCAPSIRLRYALAALTRDSVDAAALIRSVRKEKRCSRLVRQRELTRALEAAGARSMQVRRIPKRDFLNLPLIEQLVVASNARLLGALVDVEGDNPTAVTKAVLDAWAVHCELRLGLRELLRGPASPGDRLKRGPRPPLRESDIEFFNLRSEGLSLEALDDDLRAEFGSRSTKWLSLPKDRSARWVPFTSKARQVLQGLSPTAQIPDYLCLDAAEITRRLISGKISSKAIAATDLACVQRTWADEDRGELARSGRIAVLDMLSLEIAVTIFQKLARAADAPTPSIASDCLAQIVGENLCIPDAVVLLGQGRHRQLRRHIRDAIAGGSRAWIKALYPLFGTKPAVGIFVDSSPRTVKALLRCLSVGSGIVDRSRYECELGHTISTGMGRAHRRGAHAVSKLDREAAASELGEWTQLVQTLPVGSKGVVLSVAESLAPRIVRELLTQAATRNPLRQALESRIPNEETLKRINRYRIEHARTASELFEIVQADPLMIKWLRPPCVDMWKKGTANRAHPVAVLCFRRNPQRLKRLAEAIGASLFAECVGGATKLLPATSRDRGFLELAASLGARNIQILAAVMASMDRSAPAGYKLDRSYHHYELPKKSGGTRTVSVPHPILKKAQKAILIHIVDHIGAHPAVHGFVKGRSIGSNAAVHVNRQVVSNCDIAECFPSVKWSLVLGALRRSVGSALSPASISLLVDIVTMRGGLPIGAPTSPALLNCVLLKTDQKLAAEASKRDCNYSRYADDMTFSGDDRAVAMLGVARRTLAQIGLSLDAKKTNIYRRGRRQVVTGLVVNKRVSVPRRMRRRMRAAVHAAELGKPPTWHGKEEPLISLKGRVAYLRSVNRDEGERLISRLKAIRDNTDD